MNTKSAGESAGYDLFTEDDNVVRWILEPSRCALLVVDVQNDYCHPEGALGAAGFDLSAIDRMVDVIEDLSIGARGHGVPVVYLRATHSERTDTGAWRRKSKHSMAMCREGSWGAEFYRVRPQEGDPVVTKHRYSGFIGTNLEQVLRVLQRSTLVLTGTATNVCVESTARDACMLDYDVVVVSDGVADTDFAAHDMSLKNLHRFFGHVVASSHVLAAWDGSAA